MATNHVHWNRVQLDCEFEVGSDSHGSFLVWLSRDGRRRRDYALGLELSFFRLGQIRAHLTDVLIDSRRSRADGLSRDDRRVVPRGRSFPVDLGAETDLGGLFRDISSQFGARVGSGRGNTPLTRARFYIAVDANCRTIEAQVAHGPVPLVGSVQWSKGARNSLVGHDLGLPDDGGPGPLPIDDVHRLALDDEPYGQVFLSGLKSHPELRTIAEVVRRRGQGTFRRALLHAYGQTCAVSGCRIPAVLDAAHIEPFSESGDHDPSNGLLLRTDLHALFDLRLMAVHPERLIASLHPTVSSSSEYGLFHRSRVRRPARTTWHPSLEALAKHWTRCQADSW